jgi:hypothetical protein
MLGIGLAVLIGVTVIFDRLDPTNKTNSSAPSASAVENSSGPAQSPASAPPPPFDVEISASIDGGATPMVHGETNLPDGTMLLVQLRPAYPYCFDRYRYCAPLSPENSGHEGIAGAPIAVQHGQFFAGPRWVDYFADTPAAANLKPGRYVLEVQLFASTITRDQPPSVRAILGDNGEAIRGDLLNAVQLDVPAVSPEEMARQAKIDSENPEFAAVINRVLRYELRYVVEG